MILSKLLPLSTIEAETETADDTEYPAGCYYDECWCHDPTLSHDRYCAHCGCGPREDS